MLKVRFNKRYFKKSYTIKMLKVSFNKRYFKNLFWILFLKNQKLREEKPPRFFDDVRSASQATLFPVTDCQSHHLMSGWFHQLTILATNLCWRWCPGFQSATTFLYQVPPEPDRDFSPRTSEAMLIWSSPFEMMLSKVDLDWCCCCWVLRINDPLFADLSEAVPHFSRLAHSHYSV